MKDTILSVVCIIAVILINGCSPAKDKNATGQHFKINEDATDQQFKIEGLTFDNYPKVDGSTSIDLLNELIFIKLFNVEAPSLGFDNNLWDNFFRLVKTSQTHPSIIKLIDKEADIILVARRMSPDEKKYADAAGISLIETPIALDALVIIVNPENPIASLSIKQIQDIYTGKITNWKEVGGNDAPIKPYVRNTNSGSQELFESLVMKNLDIIDFPVSEIIFTMREIMESVQTDISSIGYTVYYYKKYMLNDILLKDIAIEGIYPDKESISYNTFPLTSEVYATIRSDLDKSSMAYKLYELLQTEAGKEVISKSGYVPN
jgi:phosphate transport system substrate-binding protein